MASTMANGLMMMPKTTAPLRSLSLFLIYVLRSVRGAPSRAGAAVSA